MKQLERIGKLRSIFVVNFILTLGIALTSYIDSSFVETFTQKTYVGMLFATGSLFSLIYLAYAPALLQRFGVRKIMYTASGGYLVAIMGFLIIGNPLLLQLLFLLYWLSGAALYMTVDVLLQHYSQAGNTGSTRGFYLTFYNLAFMIGPFVAGVLMSMASFRGVYAASGLFVALMANYFVHEFEKVEIFPKKNGNKLVENILTLFRNKDLRNVFLVAFILSFFFVWMSIYTPIYLREAVGFSWETIGAIFAIMHIPYVMFEIPWGILSDRYLGEKEIMGIGILIIGGATIVLSVITSHSFWVWATILFFTRLGASMVQVTTESYFFKKIKKEDTEMTSAYRHASPLAVLIAPVVGTFFLTIIPFKFLFLILGLFVFVALLPNHFIHDTR